MRRWALALLGAVLAGGASAQPSALATAPPAAVPVPAARAPHVPPTPAIEPDASLAAARFAAVATPTASPARAVGKYARGCLAGAVELAADGQRHQAMRLSRGRRWGHPDTVALVEDLAARSGELGLAGILVGDLGQARGGPLPTGHTSHQSGLDVDVWLTPMPERRLTEAEREVTPFTSVLNADRTAVDPTRLTPAMAKLVQAAASDPRTARVFVHPLIKRALCAMTWDDRAFLQQVRPWSGHDAHMHVRLSCPASSPACVPQRRPPPGDGCGAPLDAWFTAAPSKPRRGARPRQPLTLSGMPAACRTLLEAQPAAGGGDQAAAPAPTGQPTPVPLSPQ
ncbi:penicillin-insensitive murein endopeptidase [Acuticoccus sp.]|uniref:penicillin-insensitive murein endopeptidase n=1 Tax=Acuticoccus sp. TaxID=1904378 RepID=UPI003B518070